MWSQDPRVNSSSWKLVPTPFSDTRGDWVTSISQWWTELVCLYFLLPKSQENDREYEKYD